MYQYIKYYLYIYKNERCKIVIFPAIIYAFNTGILKDAEDKARQNGITIKKHNVIYKLIDDLKEEMEKILPTVEVEERLGKCY